MANFPGIDYMDVDSLFSEEELMVRQTVRDFVDAEVLPIIEDANRHEKFPAHLVPRMAEMGLFGSTIDEYGLPGLGHVAYGLIMQELERGDSGLRSFVSVQSSLVMFPIYAYGSKEQKDRWIPALGSGEAIGCFGLTEPDFGSNPGGMRTHARRDGDSWILNGAKSWITNGSIADVAVVWAKTEDGIRGFLVEKNTPGYTTAYHMGKFSLRASVTSQLFFEDCRIPAENVLPETSSLKHPLSCLSQARFGIAFGAVGAAMAVYNTALEYAKQRIQFGGKPIAAHQLVQNKLAWMITEITKAQLLALQMGRMKEQGKIKPHHISMAKMNNVNIALECARMARDILGANGVSDEYPVIRHMLNLESVKTYEGTHDIHNLIIGEAVTGIPAYNPPMTAEAERQGTAEREKETAKTT
ncbi:MAG TPA: acyl-CoA dehydrogenase family protein [Thermoanaerobaculia bacterium]|nr:acyl-CoA dehydrogenase family protein [Thermoanaerobaculia bacterium]